MMGWRRKGCRRGGSNLRCWVGQILAGATMQTTTPTFLLLPSQRPGVFLVTFMFKALFVELLKSSFCKGHNRISLKICRSFLVLFTSVDPAALKLLSQREGDFDCRRTTFSVVR